MPSSRHVIRIRRGGNCDNIVVRFHNKKLNKERQMETKNKRSQIPDSTRETRNTRSIKRENALQGIA